MTEIFIILFLILLNGVFSMSEIAMISARKSSLQNEAEDGNSKARRALKLAGDPDKFLSTIQIGITLIGILTGIFSGNEIARSLGGVFEKWGVPASTASGLAKTLIVIIVTYFSIVLGELVPKRRESCQGNGRSYVSAFKDCVSFHLDSVQEYGGSCQIAGNQGKR